MGKNKQTIKFTKFACPSCGGKALKKIIDDLFACSYCGNQFIITNENGKITNVTKNTQSKNEILSSKLAIKRIQSELDKLILQRNPTINEWDRLSTIHNKTPNYKRMLLISGIVLLVSFILFINALMADMIALGISTLLIFFITIFILIAIGINSIKRKIAENKYYKMAEKMNPINNEIEKKQQKLRIHKQNIEQQEGRINNEPAK